jgi:hypothetical protein
MKGLNSVLLEGTIVEKVQMELFDTGTYYLQNEELFIELVIDEESVKKIKIARDYNGIINVRVVGKLMLDKDKDEIKVKAEHIEIKYPKEVS